MFMSGRRPHLRMLIATTAFALPVAAGGSMAMAATASAQVLPPFPILPIGEGGPPSLAGATLHGSEGLAPSSPWTVATVTYNGPAMLQNISIDWGDGKSDAVAGWTPGSTGITGSHGYSEAGKYTVTVTANALPLFLFFTTPEVSKPKVNEISGLPLSTTSTVTVSDDVELRGVGTQVVPGGAFTGTIARGKDDNPSAPLSDLSAVINWGDSTTSDAACSSTCLTATAKGFDVATSHTYAKAGLYRVTTTLTDETTLLEDHATSWIFVPVTATSVTAVEGGTFNGPVGTLPAPPKHVEDLAAANVNIPTGQALTPTNNWGDGSPATPGILGSDGTVTGGHTYTDEGTYTVTISADKLAAVNPEVSTAAPKLPYVATSKATVTDAALLASAASGGAFTATVNKSFSSTLAHLSDGNPGATLSDLSATIDWGDGSTTTATLAGNAVSGFDAGGSHTYSTPGVKHGVVHFADKGGQVAQAPFTVTVAAAPASSVLGVSTGIGVPNTGAELPVGQGLLLISGGLVLAVLGLRRRSTER
jgi:PKD repeat protein